MYIDEFNQFKLSLLMDLGRRYYTAIIYPSRKILYLKIEF